MKFFYIIAFMEKQIIGRIDRADFPDLGLENIAIKVDTGAYTSSIHCDEIIEENNVLKCYFRDEEHPVYDRKMFTFKDYRKVQVRSSNGILQERYAISSKIKLFNRIHTISLSLNDRSDMRFPVLIGRKFLRGKFIVDPQLEDLSFTSEN